MKFSEWFVHPPKLDPKALQPNFLSRLTAESPTEGRGRGGGGHWQLS